MARNCSAILVGIMLLVVPAVGLGQTGGGELPAKDGDEVQAEADGKKSKKVKVSSVGKVKLDYSDLPKVPLGTPNLNQMEIDWLKDIEDYIPGFGDKLKRDMSKISNYTDRMAYLWERMVKLAERADHMEVNLKSGLVDRSGILKVAIAQVLIIAMRHGHKHRYLEHLNKDFPKDVAGHFEEVLGQIERNFVGAQEKRRIARRKRLGLAPLKKRRDMKEGETNLLHVFR